jgi:hypothetical protein
VGKELQATVCCIEHRSGRGDRSSRLVRWDHSNLTRHHWGTGNAGEGGIGMPDENGARKVDGGCAALTLGTTSAFLALR